MKLLLAALLGLLSATPCFSDVWLGKGDRVANRPDGYCVYCCAECVGRYHGDKRLLGLVDWYSKFPSRGAGTAEVNTCFQFLGVKYQLYESASSEWVKKQVDVGIPVIVGMRWEGEQHAIIITGFDGKWVWYWDCNHPADDLYFRRAWFDWAFTGWAIVIEKPEKE